MTMAGHVTHQPIAALKDGLVKLTEPGATKPQWSFSSGERATAGYLASNNYDTHTQPFNSLLSGTTRVGRYQKKHSHTHTHPDHRTSFIIFLHLQRSRHTLCSFYELDSPLGQPLSRSSLVFLLSFDPQLHTPCISSPNHHHLFEAHAHTNAACSAAISMLCRLHLVSLSSLLGSPK